MYTDYFGFSEPPFSITPDPRYLYMSRRHREALAHLVYGIGESGGFVQLTGEVGTGKTTVVRVVLEQLPQNVDVALVLNPRLTVLEFLSAICDELGIDYPKGGESPKSLIDALNAYLLDAHGKGRRTVLIIDEAQNLSAEVLEQVRLLTNLETTKHKLLQIFLVGQPELKTLLARTELRQVAQRITARYHLTPLNLAETREYIRHRVQVAGVKRPLFADAAVRSIHRLAGGVPRLINVLCDRALLGAYANDASTIDRACLKRAALEVLGELPQPWYRTPRVYLPLGLAALVLAVGLWVAQQRMPQSGPVEVSHALEDAEEPSVTLATVASEPIPPASIPPQPSRLSLDPEPLASPISLDEILRDPETRTDTDFTFDRLLAQWGVAPSTAATPRDCEWAARYGLRCLYARGTWNNLRRLNLPAAIELTDSTGMRHHVLVTGLRDDRVSLELTPQAPDFALHEVDAHWYGDFLVLWKFPIADERTIFPGDRGDAVIWLREQLAAADGLVPTAPVSEQFDDELKRWVMDFQRSRNLSEDGIVGTQTFLYLSTVAEMPGTPRLHSSDRE